MNLPPILQEEFDKIKEYYADCGITADTAARWMLDIANRLDPAVLPEFARDIFAPFVQKACADGIFSSYNAADWMLDMTNELDPAHREPFLNSQNIFTIDLKTKEWTSLTAKWFENDDAKMRLFILGDKPFAKCGCETVTLDNYKELLAVYNIRGRARTPFLNAVKAVKIEQENPGTFAAFDKMCRSLKPPAVKRSQFFY